MIWPNSSPGSSRRVASIIENRKIGGLAPTGLITQLLTQVRLFRDGKEIFTGKENPYSVDQQTDLKRLAVTGSIQLGTNMSAGEYVLQVVVTDLLADKKHRIKTQWMDFQMVK